MCASRQWKQIETFPFDESVNITATRSDGLILTIQTVFEKGDTIHQITTKVVNTMKRLESFRNCKCTSDQSCQKHEGAQNVSK